MYCIFMTRSHQHVLCRGFPPCCPNHIRVDWTWVLDLNVTISNGALISQEIPFVIDPGLGLYCSEMISKLGRGYVVARRLEAT